MENIANFNFSLDVEHIASFRMPSFCFQMEDAENIANFSLDVEHIADFSLATFCLLPGDVEHIANFSPATFCMLSRDMVVVVAPCRMDILTDLNY